jgi:hypothetical protein
MRESRGMNMQRLQSLRSETRKRRSFAVDRRDLDPELLPPI